jgi:hypothetical protein
MGLQICARGCLKADGKTPQKHYRVQECPRYQAEVARGQSQPEPSPQPTTPAGAAPASSGTVSGKLGFSGNAAEVRKGTTKPTPPPEPQDFKIDEPHTIRIWNHGYAILRWGCYKFDDLMETDKIVEEHPELKAKGYAAHIPQGLFKLNDWEKDAITGDPEGNWYTSFGTKACKLFGAKTRGQAHAMIDTLGLVLSGGAIIVALIDHNIYTLKYSPRLRKWKDKKKEAKAANAAPDAEKEPAGELRSLRGRVGAAT